MTEINFSSRPEKHSLRLFLVRHGQTDANLNFFLQGASNGLLNATGIQQAARLSRHLQKISLDHVYASDLQRAIDTAGEVASNHGLKVEIDSRLREWNCGELDGQPAAIFLNLVKESGKPLSQFIPPGGERLNEVRQRAIAFINDLIVEHLGESILVCSHGDFMRTMISSLLQIDIDAAIAFHFDNASYSVFEYADSRWRVLALNRIAADCEETIP